MNKASAWGMRLHQVLSFSPLFLYCDTAPAVFWPGCALMNLDPQILEKTWSVLQRAEPQIGVCTCCCGQPSRYLFPQKAEARQMRIRQILQKHGVKQVYTACPNCSNELREWAGVEVISIWPILAEYLRPQDVLGKEACCALHDPCPLRNELADQAAVRALCAMAGTEIVEPAHCKEHTLCCGNRHMLRSREPEKSAKLRQLRVAEFPVGLPITSCCEGCLGAFRSEGRETLHLLELIFGRSQKRGWRNRFIFTQKRR